jgi:hypothetical protein
VLPGYRLVHDDVARAERERAALGHRVARVHGEVDEYLLELAGIREHAPDAPEVRLQGDPVAKGAPEREPRGALCRLPDHLHVAPHWPVRELAEDELGVGEDGGEQVVEVVSDAAGQAAHGFHLLCLPELGLQRLVFRHVARIHHDALDGGIVK